MGDHRFDYIIVGAGSAGCVLADRLSERCDGSLLVLEAGSPFTRRFSIPLLGMYRLSRELEPASLERPHSRIYLDKLEDEGEQHRCDAIVTGRGAGGGSSVNAMMYTRGSAKSFQLWESAGCPGWGYEDLLPLFRRSEDFDQGPSRYHGAGGPLGVSSRYFKTPFMDAFIEAMGEHHVAATHDFNGENCAGAGYYQKTQKLGRRSSCANFLERAMRRKNVRIQYGAQVLRILMEGARAIGVEVANGGSRGVTIRANEEVILCAGALRSPQLLMLSGIGPERPLRNLGIPIVFKRDEVGRNLQDHTRFPVVFESKRRDPGDFLGKVASVPQYVLGASGLLASNNCDAGAVYKSSAGRFREDIQHVLHWRASPGNVHRRIDLEPCLVDGDSRGSVTITSKDIHVQPRIRMNYMATRCDADRIVWAIEHTRSIANSAALREFGIAAEVEPGPGVRSRADIEAYARRAVGTCFHPAGTCRMGGDDDAVVDPELRVRGVSGLRVADNSIMPVLVNGNTNSTAVMIGEKAADLIAPLVEHR